MTIDPIGITVEIARGEPNPDLLLRVAWNDTAGGGELINNFVDVTDEMAVLILAECLLALLRGTPLSAAASARLWYRRHP